MTSQRAENVAEVLWELKKAEKLGLFSHVARRAGFKPGINSRTLLNALEAVRRDWPHLQWWRAVPDDGFLVSDSEHCLTLLAQGYTVQPQPDGRVKLVDLDLHGLIWEENSAEVSA